TAVPVPGVRAGETLVCQNDIAVAVLCLEEFHGDERWVKVGRLGAPRECQLRGWLDDGEFAPMLEHLRRAVHHDSKRPPHPRVELDDRRDDVSRAHPGTHPLDIRPGSEDLIPGGRDPFPDHDSLGIAWVRHLPPRVDTM